MRELFNRALRRVDQSVQPPFIGVLFMLLASAVSSAGEQRNEVPLPRPPVIFPDYGGITMPFNIAPLNFAIQEPGTAYEVQMSSVSGEALELKSKSPEVIIPRGGWKRLLAANKEQELWVKVRVKERNGTWQSFQTITNRISGDPIDPYLAYRLLHPQFTLFGSGTIGIFQRNLETYDEDTILQVKDRTGERGYCINCHTFLNRRPDTFALHLRGAEGKAMLVVTNGQAEKIDLTAGYMSWHPSGKLIAFSRNKLSLFFHSVGETRDVYDGQSDLAIYRLDSNTVTSPPALAQSNRQENWPMWAADGRHLYFCSTVGAPLEQFKNIRYDLMRVAYDVEKDAWGEPETLLTAEQTGRSLVEPRPSPDGRFLLFTMCDYGHFPIYQSNSVNMILDLQTRQYRPLEVNSGRGETWHCWSSNGRWIVFSSKRLNRLLTRPFFAHMDAEGHAAKPFVLPQRDPGFYEHFLKTYNVPEFVTGPVDTQRPLFRAAIEPTLRKPNSTAPTVVEQSDEAGPARR